MGLPYRSFHSKKTKIVNKFVIELITFVIVYVLESHTQLYLIICILRGNNCALKRNKNQIPIIESEKMIDFPTMFVRKFVNKLGKTLDCIWVYIQIKFTKNAR